MPTRFEINAISKRHRDADHRIAAALCLFVALAILSGMLGGIEVDLL